MNPVEILQDIAAQVSKCEKCQLHFSRKNAVPGEGPANAEIMFIGEGRVSTKMNKGVHLSGRRGNSWMSYCRQQVITARTFSSLMWSNAAHRETGIRYRKNWLRALHTWINRSK